MGFYHVLSTWERNASYHAAHWLPLLARDLFARCQAGRHGPLCEGLGNDILKNGDFRLGTGHVQSFSCIFKFQARYPRRFGTVKVPRIDLASRGGDRRLSEAQGQCEAPFLRQRDTGERPLVKGVWRSLFHVTPPGLKCVHMAWKQAEAAEDDWQRGPADGDVSGARGSPGHEPR